MTAMRLSMRAAYEAGRLQGWAASEAPTLLLCALLLVTVWGTRPAPAVHACSAAADDERPLAVKITFFDGVDSARYEVADPADFDPLVLLEVHRQFYGHAARANADIDEEP